MKKLFLACTILIFAPHSYAAPRRHHRAKYMRSATFAKKIPAAPECKPNSAQYENPTPEALQHVIEQRKKQLQHAWQSKPNVKSNAQFPLIAAAVALEASAAPEHVPLAVLAAGFSLFTNSQEQLQPETSESTYNSELPLMAPTALEAPAAQRKRRRRRSQHSQRAPITSTDLKRYISPGAPSTPTEPALHERRVRFTPDTAGAQPHSTVQLPESAQLDAEHSTTQFQFGTLDLGTRKKPEFPAPIARPTSAPVNDQSATLTSPVGAGALQNRLNLNAAVFIPEQNRLNRNAAAFIPGEYWLAQ